jgi:hypothetical protein
MTRVRHLRMNPYSTGIPSAQMPVQGTMIGTKEPYGTFLLNTASQGRCLIETDLVRHLWVPLEV